MIAASVHPLRHVRRSFRERLPEGTVLAARPSRWGNPFVVESVSPGEWQVMSTDSAFCFGVCVCSDRDAAQAMAVDLYRAWLLRTENGRGVAAMAREQLRGKRLACYCKAGTPCHVDVLIEVANAGKGTS